jgi:hypothetical protein
LKAKQLLAVARSHPEECYSSAVLDVLLERRLVVPRSVWRVPLAERPLGLMPAMQALAKAFSNDKSASAGKWLAGLLNAEPTLRAPLLQVLLFEPEASLRLARFVFSDRATMKRRTVLQQLHPFANEWVDVCERCLVRSGQDGEVAALVLCHLRLRQISAPAQDVAGPALLGEAAVRRAVLTLLRHGHGGDSDSVGARPFLIASGALESLLREYLDKLPLGASDDGALEPRLRLERFAGRKEVLVAVAEALAEGANTQGLQDALQVLLINAGVTRFGDAGEAVRLDLHQHEPETPGQLPGDSVVVSRPGWRMGEGDDAVVLVRAKVR